MTSAIITSIKEPLAAYSHDAWRFWMYYMFSKSTRNADGTVTIPAELVERWNRQTETDYAKLPEAEKESDRVEADKMIAIFIGTPIHSDEEPASEVEIDLVLRQAGYDPEQVGRMGVKVALAAADQSPLNPKNVKMAQLEAEIANLMSPDKMVVTKAAWERKQKQAELHALIEQMPPDSYLMHCPVTNQVAWQAIAGDIDSPDCKIAWGDTPLETLQKLIPMLKENHDPANHL